MSFEITLRLPVNMHLTYPQLSNVTKTLPHFDTMCNVFLRFCLPFLKNFAYKNFSRNCNTRHLNRIVTQKARQVRQARLFQQYLYKKRDLEFSFVYCSACLACLTCLAFQSLRFSIIVIRQPGFFQTSELIKLAFEDVPIIPVFTSLGSRETKSVGF